MYQQGSAKQNSVVDLSAYRTAKSAQKTSDVPDDSDAARTIEQIAHHLLMAVRAIRAYHQNH